MRTRNTHQKGFTPTPIMLLRGFVTRITRSCRALQKRFNNSSFLRPRVRTTARLVSGFTPTPFLTLFCNVFVRTRDYISHVVSLFLSQEQTAIRCDVKKGCRGFTLIETLVGITILVIAVTATLTTVATNISYSGSAREEVTAFFLAQEAIEIIRNTRDNNAIGGGPWLQGIQGNCQGSSGCYVDGTNTSNPTASCGSVCPNLKLNNEGVYQYTSGGDTVFRREVYVTDIVNNKEATIRVSVYWPRGGIEKSFTITENIFNWQN